ncbi:Brca1-a complex subunit abraxas [Plakobranchus ocellatus]|uniref:Brca1-a complex subunit abraxas n=1 Tax=Plakobranchus ocellatus TaxID=259542 RepID=A0AAV3ZF73_9GAST|nr:Brca1-a complex subunit abraxas [Plakobranchus ocellatus]
MDKHGLLDQILTAHSPLYHIITKTMDMYGLLLGEKISHVEDRISDSQIHTADVNSLFCISTFLPWPKDEPLYTRSGCLNDECLERYLATIKQSVVGWYSFRHKSALRPSLREITLHKSLACEEKFDQNLNDFFFFLCTSSSTSNLSTFSSKHAFLQLKEGCFIEMPMTIQNLGDTTRREYRKQSNITLSHCSSIHETLQKAKGHFVQSSGEMDQVFKVKYLSSSLNRRLETVHSKLTQSEGALGLLEAEVDTLRMRIKQLEQDELSEQLAADARKRQREEQQERIKEDAVAEAEEQAQMEKLLKDLGLNQQPQQSSSSATASSDPSNGPVAFKDYSKEDILEKKSSSSKEKAESKMERKELTDSSDSDSDVAILKLDAKKLNGQKTYSNKEPNVQQKVDPFDFLSKEVGVQKENLAKRQSASNTQKPLTIVGKKSTIQFTELSSSLGVNDKGKSCEKNGCLNSDALMSDFSVDDASNSSNGVHPEESVDDSQKSLNNDENGSFCGNQTLVISSSPTF